jgi:acyl-CoA thioester hydrolase
MTEHETYRGVVYPTDCDVMGHMNIASFVRAFDQATQHFFHKLGSDPSEPLRGEWGWADVKLTIDYHGEARPGDLLYIVSRPETLGKRSITHRHELRNAATGGPLATASFVTVRFDLRARRSAELPGALRNVAAAWIAEGRA